MALATGTTSLDKESTTTDFDKDEEEEVLRLWPEGGGTGGGIEAALPDSANSAIEDSSLASGEKSELDVKQINVISARKKLIAWIICSTIVRALNETFEFKKNDISIETEKVKKVSENISHDYITLLCDAAWKGGFKAGCGFLIEDADSNILEKGSSIEIATNLLYAEAKAIWVGPDNVREKNLRRIQVRTDCDRLVRILKGYFQAPWEISVLIAKIKSLALEVEVLNWIHHTCEEKP
ncbi:hypothetical protein Cni_G28690 [Canna indica]|uniref:RNase H type-1 domain-containing protein n=1 Tax=Canna indica TaxID=4628 RepID=A0AAQ3QSP2_9LILI|nr:hypothetical protein Cni_G28690 [Canna indica]